MVNIKAGATLNPESVELHFFTSEWPFARLGVNESSKMKAGEFDLAEPNSPAVKEG